MKNKIKRKNNFIDDEKDIKELNPTQMKIPETTNIDRISELRKKMEMKRNLQKKKKHKNIKVIKSPRPNKDENSDDPPIQNILQKLKSMQKKEMIKIPVLLKTP